MKLYNEYEELMIKILGIIGAVMLGTLFIVLLTKFALKIVITFIMISAILFGAGAVYLGICFIIDYDERFGLK